MDIVAAAHIVAELSDAADEPRGDVVAPAMSSPAPAPRPGRRPAGARRASVRPDHPARTGFVRACLVLALGGLPLLLLLLACADSGDLLPPSQVVAAVTVAPEARTLAGGDTATLTAMPRDAAGRSLAGRAISWTSSDEAVVTVSPTGHVAAGRAGTAIVSAVSEGQVGRAAVTVVPGPLAQLSFELTGAVLALGERRDVTAIGRDAVGNVLRLGAVVWTIDNPAVATVTTVGAVGIVTAVAPGTAVLTATTGGRSARVELTVRPSTAGASTHARL